MWARRKRGSSEVSLEMVNANNETARQLDPTDFAPNPEETCLQPEQKRIVASAITDRSVLYKTSPIGEVSPFENFATNADSATYGWCLDCLVKRPEPAAKRERG